MYLYYLIDNVIKFLIYFFKDLVYNIEMGAREGFYVIIQYLNTEINSSMVDFTIINNGVTQTGMFRLIVNPYVFQKHKNFECDFWRLA